MFRILAVDDDKRYLKLIKTIFEIERMEIHLAESAAEALAAIKEREFDLILTDLRMPSIDGTELAMMTRDISPYLPIVMITGDIVPKISELAKGVGIKRVLNKAISSREMVRVVKEEAIKWKMYKELFLVEAVNPGNPHIATWVCPRCQTGFKGPLPQKICTSCGYQE